MMMESFFDESQMFIQHDDEIDQLYSKLKENHDITVPEMEAEKEWEEIYDYYLTPDFVLARHIYMANKWDHSDANNWYDEFYNFPTHDQSSFIERRALYLEDLANAEKNPVEFEYIGRNIDISSLMMLDSLTGYGGSWYYYDCLCQFYKQLSRKIDPVRWEEYDRLEAEEEAKRKEEEKEKKRKKVVIEIEKHFPEGVRRVNGELQVIDPESGIWYKTQEEFGFKPNLFVWIKEQGNSEVLTEYLENWKKTKPKLSFNRKRHQIVIKNIIKGVCERHLYVLAQAMGVVYDIAFPVNKITGKQDVAFIEFKTLEEVQRAIRLLDKMPLGRAIIYVEEFVPRFSK
jgi:hypothetical protein